MTSTSALLAAARANLSDAAWDKLIGGTESETTLRRNRMGFDSLAFRPRVQSRDAAVDASTTFLGHRIRIPVMASPIGSLHRLTPGGAEDAARAAGEFDTVAFVSSASRAGFENVARAAAGPLVLQLAFRGDLEWCAEVLDRTREAGYAAVCVTVDTARLGRQERQIVNNRRAQPAEHPFRTGLTWTDLDQIKRIAGLPLIVKGIGCHEDARIAVDHGVDAICVSNHGGHSVDHGRAAIDILPEVVEAVGGRAEVVMDGGVMRGSDVVKALARGARAAMIGKLQGIGLAAAGESGLRAVLEILEDEIITCLELLGAADANELEAGHLQPARPVNLPTDTSAFPNRQLHLDRREDRVEEGEPRDRHQRLPQPGRTELKAMGAVEAFTNAELVAAARESLTGPAWSRLVGAAESETTARRNRMALDSIALRPRVLVGVTDVDTSARLLGQQIRLPVLLANIGDLDLLWPGGAGAVAGAASRLGIARLVAPDSHPAADEADSAGSGLRILEISAHIKPDQIRGLVSDAEQTGSAAVCLSLVPHGAGRREREPHTPAPLPRRTRDAWSAVDLAVGRSRLPVIVKGVMGGADALTAIEHGCAAIYVSNYGGRALDHCEGTIDVLAEVAEVAAGRAEIIVDGGFMRGTDVIKALATGAQGVAIGRLQGLALAAAGAPGLVRALEILEEELRVSLALLGATSIDALSGSHLFRDVPPVEFPTELSALFPGADDRAETNTSTTTCGDRPASF